MKKVLREFDLPLRDIAAIWALTLFVVAVAKWSEIAAAMVLISRSVAL